MPRPVDADPVDAATDSCARGCGSLMMAIAIAAVTLSFLATLSCDFLTLNIPVLSSLIPTNKVTISPTVDDDSFFFNDTVNGTILTEAPTMAPSSAPTTVLLTISSIGVFRYYDKVDETCYYYDPAQIETAYYQVARLGMVVMSLSSLTAVFILLVEFCFCRFYCGRMLMVIGFILAVLGGLTSMTIFFDPKCRPKDGELYICERSQGANMVIAAMSCFVAVLVLVCFTPKAVPVIRIADSMNLQDSEFLNCCGGCCRFSPFHRRRRGDDKVMDATAPMEEVELVHAVDGHSYKQYHDETAGLTFQNQYTAAYRRWLVFEEDYEKALSRFKEECEEAHVNWRYFLSKARQRQQGDNFADETMATAEEHLDEELLRFVDVLNTLRNNCTFAKGVMERIQNDIQEQTRTEDERRRQEEQKTLPKSTSKVSLSSHRRDVTEYHSTAATMDLEESPLLAETSSNATFPFDRSNLMVDVIEQDNDIFTSARMTQESMSTRVNPYGDTFTSARMTQDAMSTKVNPSSIVSSHDVIEEEDESSAEKQRRSVLGFVPGFRTVNWAWNKMRPHDG